jgi:hypothetical protein
LLGGREKVFGSFRNCLLKLFEAAGQAPIALEFALLFS